MRLSTLAFLGLTALLATAGHAQTSYTVTDLGVVGSGNTSWPYALNSKSASNIMVVGRSLGVSIDQGFYWSTSGGMVALSGINLNNGKTYRADPNGGLNSRGDVVGQSVPNDSTSVNFRAFYWNPNRGAGNSLNLDPDPASQGSTANAINESGVIAGQANGKAVYWQPSSPSPYSPPMALTPPTTITGGITEYAVAINANGDILGRCADSSWVRYAVVWKNSGTLTTPVYGAATVLGAGTYPRVMNDAAQAVASYSGGAQALFLLLTDGTYSAVALADVVANASQVWGMNNSALMSGHLQISTPTGSQMRAAVWTSDGAIYNLGTLGGTQSRAEGIHFKGMGHTVNSSGKGIGYSTLSSGDYHGIRWSWDATVSKYVMRDLNDSALTPNKGVFSYLKDSACITDEGYITGSGITVKGKYEHAYVLTPNP